MKSKELKVATDIKGNELKAGDRVAYVSCLYDPLIGTGTVTKIYDTAPEQTKDSDVAKFWNIKATIRDDNGRLMPNIQIRRILKIH